MVRSSPMCAQMTLWRWPAAGAQAPCKASSSEIRVRIGCMQSAIDRMLRAACTAVIWTPDAERHLHGYLAKEHSQDDGEGRPILGLLVDISSLSRMAKSAYPHTHQPQGPRKVGIRD
ncbi:hypothetical protein BC628DRAFT_1365211 [Trametes gibbosa]|nr:hypothetical protein BC628DRAFT_1386217 [Trametes gibbosa]KAI0828288.1 hypothetical protein BC628DRAFT_1365211 [Trametes gibbosa]